MQRSSQDAKGKDFTKNFDFQPHHRGKLAKEILSMIASDVVIPASFLMPIAPKALKPLLGPMLKRCHTKRSDAFIKSLSYLNKNRLVSIAEKNGQQILTLSENGKKRLLHFDLDRMVIKKPKKWDGYWRIVLFDIPERKKQGREVLRSKLKQLGFYQLQKSCFIHPFDCKSEIDYISELFEVSPYVNFIVAKEIEGTAQLQKIFHLP